jgi:hypothetical protein
VGIPVSSARARFFDVVRLAWPWRSARLLIAQPILAAFMLWRATGLAQAQLIEQYFPSDIPGYTPDFSASVVNRMEMQDQSDGVEIGDFVIRPSINENAGYDSNTLGRSDSGSTELETSAGLQANSDWTRNALNFSFNVDNLRYFDVPVASYTNWTLGAGGSVNLGDDVASLGYTHLALNLAATSLGVIGVETPVPYSVDDIRASYLKLFGRISLTPGFEFEHYGFGQGGSGDQPNYQSLTHHVEIGSLTGRFEASPGDALVLILRPSFAQFDHDSANNYSDIAGFAGIDVRGARIIQYRILFGFEHRSFSDHSTPSVTTPTFELDAVWTPTELDTITATGVHRLDDPSSPFARDEDLLDGRLELDHELRTNLFLTGYVEAARSNSRAAIANIGSVEQTQVNAGASAVWNINRHLSGTISYGYSLNDSPRAATTAAQFVSNNHNFSSNRILIGFRLYD